MLWRASQSCFFLLNWRIYDLDVEDSVYITPSGMFLGGGAGAQALRSLMTGGDDEGPDCALIPSSRVLFILSEDGVLFVICNLLPYE